LSHGTSFTADVKLFGPDVIA